jgi:hypothetical protein
MPNPSLIRLLSLENAKGTSFNADDLRTIYAEDLHTIANVLENLTAGTVSVVGMVHMDSMLIEEGDAVTIDGSYTFRISTDDWGPIVGKALTSGEAGEPIVIAMHGVMAFRTDETSFPVNGDEGIIAVPDSGKVQRPVLGSGMGTVIGYDADAGTVDVFMGIR